MNKLSLEFLASMFPRAEKRDIAKGQLHWYDETGAECSITEFAPKSIKNAKDNAKFANDIAFVGNFRFTRTI